MSADTANAYTGPVVIDDSNGIKTIVDYREDEEGRRVKVEASVLADAARFMSRHITRWHVLCHATQYATLQLLCRSRAKFVPC